MKRTGFKRKPHSPFSSLTRTATLKRQKAIVKRIKRPTVAEGSKYLAAAAANRAFCVCRVCAVLTRSTKPLCRATRTNRATGSPGR